MNVRPEILHELRQDTLVLLRELRAIYEAAFRLDLRLPEKIEDYFNVFENETQQVEALTMTVAVVGTMKAGKSTLLNAIIRDEVLPSRELGMTAMPTMIHRRTDLFEPRSSANRRTGSG